MAKLCMQILYLKWIVNRKEWNDNFDGPDKPQNSNDGNYRLLKMIGIYSATCRKCTLLRHTATALFNNDNNCKGLIWESYLIWAKQPMIPSNGHQNYVVQRFMANFFIAVEIHRKNSIWIFAPKIDKILLFWREKFKYFTYSFFPYFHQIPNIWIFAPKLFYGIGEMLSIFGAKIQIYEL